MFSTHGLSKDETERMSIDELVDHFRNPTEEETLKKKKPYEDDDDEVRIRLREREPWYDEEER